MRYRERDFSLLDRTLPSGLHVYYYRVYIDGKRKTYSTGIGYSKEKDRVKKRREAEAYCHKLLDSGALVPSESDGITLERWIDQTEFWDWQRSDYVMGKLARSSPDRPSITENYVKGGSQITRDHILPYHGKKRIRDITPADCDQLIMQWRNKVTHKTCNNWRSIYSTIMGEAARLGAIPRNPWKDVPELSGVSKSYGALTIAEVKQILSSEGLDLSDPRVSLYYTATKLAFLTGMRIGEVCGLWVDDVIDITVKEVRLSYIKIQRQYNPKTGKVSPPKDKDARDVPISAELREELSPFLSGQFVFSFYPDKSHPITANRLREWLYGRMDKAGIPDRKERNITFHSSRRFFNTLLRHAGVTDDVIQRFTGHSGLEMTNDYTDYLPEDLGQIAQAQRLLLN